MGVIRTLLRIEELLFADFERCAVAVEFLEEAALVAGMAGAAGLLDFEEQRIGVAIGGPANDLLRVAAGLAFEPVLFAASGSSSA